ncbi:hypothetical protein LWI29_013926 [Acer saccharum]|uniref:RNase H type-1 domain-containing protein n=1 Tax=Acer saccharum TaxID=4024 RepID=A0AA39RKS6_ACESA|nr:hypothetical protein LWI29_013926 [Acer saccharum]
MTYEVALKVDSNSAAAKATLDRAGSGGFFASGSTNSEWCPPPLNHFKLNVDVASGLSGAVGVGAVLLDHLGAVKSMFSLPRLGCFDAKVGELFAIREALFAARHVGFPVALVEIDSLIDVSNIKNNFSSAFQQPLIDDVSDTFPFRCLLVLVCS